MPTAGRLSGVEMVFEWLLIPGNWKLGQEQHFPGEDNKGLQRDHSFYSEPRELNPQSQPSLEGSMEPWQSHRVMTSL